MNTGAQVAVARLDQVIASSPSAPETWLSASELARAERLRVPARLRQYLAGHWLLRQLLAQHCGGAAQHWTLQEREHQPPAAPTPGLQLALSHSGDWIAAAIAPLPIGIDIEQRRPRPALLKFAELLQDPGSTPGSLDEDQLLQRWVLKEALIKRDHGSALPEQLAAITLQRSAADNALELLSSADYHLAIACSAPAKVQAPLPWLLREPWSAA